MRKYAQVFRISSRNQVVYLPAFLARNIFFVLIIFIFSSLWSAIYAGRDFLAGLTMTQVLWYFTLTEVIELSKTNVYSQIQEEVKDGTIAYTLTRPFSYIMYYFSQAMGQNLVKMGPMLVEAFVLGTLFAGYLPGYFKAIPFGLILIVGGFCVVTLWQIIIGLLAFWFEEVSPFYWIVQKLIFIIGGMFFPIDMFPDWLAGISKASPFAFSAYWPAITIVNFSYESFFTCLLGQIVYGGALLTVCALLFRAAVKKVHVQGG
jgi:ABC-2 type transport system permease protein